MKRGAKRARTVRSLAPECQAPDPRHARVSGRLTALPNGRSIRRQEPTPEAPQPGSRRRCAHSVGVVYFVSVCSGRRSRSVQDRTAVSPRAPAGNRRSAEDPGLSFFFENSADPLVILDGRHVILDANRAATTFFGRPVEALKGTPALEIDLLARMLTAGSVLQRIKTDPPPVIEEVSVTDAEGQPIQCRIQAIPFEGDRMLLHFQNTTAVLRSRSALRSAEQLHHAMFEALPAVAWTMMLPEERLIEISPAVESMFGFQPAAFRTHPELWDDLVHPADRERVRSEFRRGIASARPFEIEFTGLHRDHRDLPFLVNRVVPVADDRGWIDRCEGFIEDRSAQRTLQATLHTTEAHLRHTLEAVASGVLVLMPEDGQVRVVLCNRRLAMLLRLDEPLAGLAAVGGPRRGQAPARRGEQRRRGRARAPRAVRGHARRDHRATRAAPRAAALLRTGARHVRTRDRAHPHRRGRHLVVADAAAAHARAEDGEHGAARRRRRARLQQPARRDERLRRHRARADAAERSAARAARTDRAAFGARHAAHSGAAVAEPQRAVRAHARRLEPRARRVVPAAAQRARPRASRSRWISTTGRRA